MEWNLEKSWALNTYRTFPKELKGQGAMGRRLGIAWGHSTDNMHGCSITPRLLRIATSYLRYAAPAEPFPKQYVGPNP